MLKLKYPYLILAGIFGVTGCATQPFIACDLPESLVTEPIHTPIYPTGRDSQLGITGEAVTFSLQLTIPQERTIQKIQLYEQESTIDANGTTTNVKLEVLLQEWSSPSGSFVSFPRTDPYDRNTLIRYRFQVTDDTGAIREHPVSFVTDPYPPSGTDQDPPQNRQPAPVYVQGAIDQTMDVIFIPDEDITDRPAFRNHARLMISQGLFADSMVKYWNRQFNFYLNPLTGKSSVFGHTKPLNWANLTFAEGQVLMHAMSMRDHAEGSLFSTEQENRGTMLHEAGHALFGLGDEYKGGGHWELENLTNNWTDRKQAKKDGVERCIPSPRVTRIHPGWFKICDARNDQMNNPGLDPPRFDTPCQQRVEYTIRENAGL